MGFGCFSDADEGVEVVHFLSGGAHTDERIEFFIFGGSRRLGSFGLFEGFSLIGKSLLQLLMSAE